MSQTITLTLDLVPLMLAGGFIAGMLFGYGLCIIVRD